MDPVNQLSSTHQEDVQFLSHSHASKEDFSIAYRRIYHGNPSRAKELHRVISSELEKALSDDNVTDFKRFGVFINQINDIESRTTLKTYYNDVNNPIGRKNFVILACKRNRLKILEYVFSNTEVFKSLTIFVGKDAILPDDKDETSHDAFYYAIRSGNVELLNVLINKWPDNYFNTRFDKLDEIVSGAYEELKLKNVSLSDEMEIFVESKLIDLRFISNSPSQHQNAQDSLRKIGERINIVLKSITSLKSEYSNDEKIDAKFLFVTRFIAQNLHVLKRLLKLTYDRLPWEEMEFCLVAFVSSHMKSQEINLFYRAIMSKSKILLYLETFADKLSAEKPFINSLSLDKLAELPKSTRDVIVAGITRCDPQFSALYNDYQQIRDMHSLERVSTCLNLALSVNAEEREGQLTIIRALQVIGEYFKNTLESPKLSSTTSKLLLLYLPQNTRKFIIDLRNSLSHAYSLSKRTEIEENTNAGFFMGVQNDTKRIDNVINNILYNNRIKMIETLLKKIANSDNFDEIKFVGEVIKSVKLEEVFSHGFNLLEVENIEKLIQQLSEVIIDQNDYEKNLFDKINSIISSEKTKSSSIRMDYSLVIFLIPRLCSMFGFSTFDHNILRGIKFFANKILEHFIPQVESNNLKEIIELSMIISSSAGSREEQDDKLDTIERLTYEIFSIAAFGVNDIKWIEKLRKRLLEKSHVIFVPTNNKTCNAQVDKYNKQLTKKLSELKKIFKKDACGKLIEYKKNKKLQAVVEMLVLDILSILGRSEKHQQLENNLLFLDCDTPLLTGKALRNHLAHDNALLDILLCDPSSAVVLNAEKLTSVNIVKSKKKIGKMIADDPIKLNRKYNLNLASVINQENMFAALMNGNLEDLKSCLEKGADINAKTISLKTALHCAAQGPSVDAVKFVINQSSSVSVTDRDIDGQSPFHLAAANGRDEIVRFLITDASVTLNAPNNFGETPLHIAAMNGHENVVKILLEDGAITDIKDHGGNSPLHYAASNNHIRVVEVLIKKEGNVDINETKGGFTSLHIAAEFGCLEVVEFLLKNGAQVNAKNDKTSMPLHTAALHGHLKVVNALILNGADVNAKLYDGRTPLHFAVENGHYDVADVLIKHGANVDTAEKSYGNTPLHYVAKHGYERIVELLLQNKASVNVITNECLTPLHFAAQKGHVNIAASLLKHGVHVHAKDLCRGYTALHDAAGSGHKEVAQILIQSGANVNAKSYNYSTPLHFAALEGHEHVVKLLIRNNADVQTPNSMGYSPLYAAAKNGHKAVIDILLKSKAQVNSRSNQGETPLHLLARGGYYEAIASLLKYKADLNVKDYLGVTPLHEAILSNSQNVVEFLIKNGAEVNVKSVPYGTPLNTAVLAECKEIVLLLVVNGANVNLENDSTNSLPLISAIMKRSKDIVEILVAKGASVNADNGAPLFTAVLSGRTDIVDILLKNHAPVDVKDPDNTTPLHLAAKGGFVEICNALISKGADVNAKTFTCASPLLLAAQEGHFEVAEILLEKGARIDINTPLHIAAAHGHVRVVKVLLSKGARIYEKDEKGRTALELAVASGHLPIVEMLIQNSKANLNTMISNNNFTLLHIATQENNLEIVKYLVDKEVDIHAKNSFGVKAIHIAARKGFVDAVEFFLTKGVNIEEPGMNNQTLLHFAALYNQLVMTKYLIKKGANVNAKDSNGATPLHIAAAYGYREVTIHLLQNGAIYNAIDESSYQPIDRASSKELLDPIFEFHQSCDLNNQVNNRKDVADLLKLIGKLFHAVKSNCTSDVEKCIKDGALVDVKNTTSETTPLHYASWKGYKEIVDILLENKADPNAVCSAGFTALHYAVKFSHLECVKVLMHYGAVYNIASQSGKTPLDFAKDKNIINLFNIINNSFKKVRNNNKGVMIDLNKVEESDLKAIMNTRNRENKCLIGLASQSNFELAKILQYVSQGTAFVQFSKASELLNQGNYVHSLSIFRRLFEKRKQLLGPNNPSTLHMQTCIAKVFYKQGYYHEALDLLSKIFQKQTDVLGEDSLDTLETRSMIALVMHRQGKDEEAVGIYQQVYQKQKELLGPNHQDTVNTQFHMALVLHSLGRLEEALSINKAVFESRKRTSGLRSQNTIAAQNNIAMVLNSQHKYEEALKMYKEVYERKKEILGVENGDTLRTLHSIGGVLFQQQKLAEALETFKEVLNLQKKVFSPHHPETLTTQYNMANVLFQQGKCISAFQAYKECYDQTVAIFGPNHPTVLDALAKMKMITEIKFKIEETSPEEILEHFQKAINVASNDGDVQVVSNLLSEGADVNDQDTEGRAPLHFAVNNGHIKMVKLLLENGANVALVTSKGNTPLHTAASKNYEEIAELLLRHINRDKLHNFVNAKTTTGGMTSLHVAAKNGYLKVVKLLLKNGAIYDVSNREGKMPIDLASDQKIIEFFESIKELFECVKKGKIGVIDKLRAMKRDDFTVITSTRNCEEYGLLKVAIVNKHKIIANALVERMQKLN